MLLNCGIGDLRVPWTARRSNLSILKEISPGCSLEGLMLKLKLQYSGHPMQKADSLERPWCWERLRAGGEGADRGWDGWMASPTQWTWIWVNSRNWWWTGKPGVLRFMGSQRVGHDWATELNWTSHSYMTTGETSLITTPHILPQDWTSPMSPQDGKSIIPFSLSLVPLYYKLASLLLPTES